MDTTGRYVPTECDEVRPDGRGGFSLLLVIGGALVRWIVWRSSFLSLGLLGLFVVVAGCAAAVQGEQQEEAGCAAPAPVLAAQPAQASPSETFRLKGKHFAGRYVCNDTGRGDSRIEAPRGFPDRGIRIDFVQGTRTWALTTVDSDEDLAFDARLEVPDGAAPGRAVVRATSRNPSPGPAETPFRVLD